MPDSLASDFRNRFQKYVGKPILGGVLLRDLSNFRIGGPADYFFEARTAANLRAAVRAARESGLPHYVMGGGFNLLFDDAGFRGLLIKIALRGMELLGEPGGSRPPPASRSAVSWNSARPAVSRASNSWPASRVPWAGPSMGTPARSAGRSEISWKRRFFQGPTEKNSGSAGIFSSSATAIRCSRPGTISFSKPFSR